MNGKLQEKQRNIRFSDGTITAYAAAAALKTNGVAQLSGGRTNFITKNFRMRDVSPKGVKVSHSDRVLIFDIYIAVEYGSKIPIVCWDLQKNIKNAVEQRIKEPVAAINIHVRGVKFPRDKEDFRNE